MALFGLAEQRARSSNQSTNRPITARARRHPPNPEGDDRAEHKLLTPQTAGCSSPVTRDGALETAATPSPEVSGSSKRISKYTSPTVTRPRLGAFRQQPPT
jgi:hypothetical protein